MLESILSNENKELLKASPDLLHELMAYFIDESFDRPTDEAKNDVASGTKRLNLDKNFFIQFLDKDIGEAIDLPNTDE